MRDAVLPPSISVVICTRDRPASLRATLESIAAQDYPSFDVLVIDQSRGEETRRLVEDARWGARKIRYIHLDTPGLSRAYNAGVRQTEAGLIAFTDDDVVAPPHWLSSIALAFTRHPEVGLLYGQVLIPADQIEREGQDGVTPGIPIPEREVLDRRRGFRIFGMGANFAARRELFDQVGGFDEVLGGGGPLQSSQDFDFMYRVFRSGRSTLLEPDVVVYHLGFRSTPEWDATVRSYGIGVGGFCLKHIRMGDAYALWILCGFLGRTSAQLIKRVLTLKPAGEQWTFLSNILSGMGRSVQFPIDRRRRIYSSAALVTATQTETV
jgi:GT2 family glycosyltransferase